MKNEGMRTIEIEYAVTSAIFANAFGSSYWLAALSHLNPWRSVLAGMALVGAVAVWWDIEEQPLPFLAAWAVALVLFGGELLNRRVLVSSRAIVVHSGLFGGHRAEYPLAQVRRVEHSYASLGRLLDVGDIEIEGDGWGLSLVAVKEPEATAQRILAMREQA